MVRRSLVAGLRDDGRHLAGLVAYRERPGEIEGSSAAQLPDSSDRVNGIARSQREDPLVILQQHLAFELLPEQDGQDIRFNALYSGSVTAYRTCSMTRIAASRLCFSV